jgi:hypothetical protein
MTIGLSGSGLLAYRSGLILGLSDSLSGSSDIFLPILNPHTLFQIVAAAASGDISVNVFVLLGRKLFPLEVALYGSGDLFVNLSARAGPHPETFTTVGLRPPAPPKIRLPQIVDRINVKRAS